MKIPAGLDWCRGLPGGAEWLASLPSIVERCAQLWALRVDTPFEGGNISLVLPAELPDGRSAVLKVNFPEPDSECEADALVHWDGRGAVLLVAHDRDLRALLVERCIPGSQLWSVEDDQEATRIGAGF